MKDYMKDFDVPGKHPSKSALQKWPVSMVKNPRRRFRHVADLAKREIHQNRFNKMERHVSLELAKANIHSNVLDSMKSRYPCSHQHLNTSNVKPLEEDDDDEDRRYLTSLWVFGSRDIHGPESPQPPKVMSENSDNESSNSGYVGTKRKRKRSGRVISLEEIQKHTRKPIDEAAVIHNDSMSMVGHSFTNQQEQTNLPDVRAQPKMSVIEQHIENTAANTVQDLTVEATYKENTVRFPFILSDGLVTLEELIAKRFLLSLGSFKLKYEDKDGDMILVAIDKDLEGSVGDSRQPVDPTVVKLAVKDRCPSEVTLGPYFA